MFLGRCLILTSVLILLVGALAPTLTLRSSLLLAQVGIGLSAGVLPNGFNTLAEELRERERALATQEAELAERAEALRHATERDRTQDRAATTSALAGGLLLVALVLLNYYLDLRARRRAEEELPTPQPNQPSE